VATRSNRPYESNYDDFIVVVSNASDNCYPVEIRSPAGDLRTNMTFPFDRRTLIYQLLALENALLRSGKPRRVTASAEDLLVQEFGQALFEAILPEDARRLFYQSQREAKLKGRKGLRLKLRIEAPDLAALPWEFLYDPLHCDYVALSAKTPIVRDFALAQPTDPLLVTPPLRILGMISNPSNLSQLDVVQERHRIEDALQNAQDSGLVELTWLEKATWRDLQQVFRRGDFHIFHFVGHGGFNETIDGGIVALTDDEGLAYLLPATQLARLLVDQATLRLVVLNSCDGARGGGTDIFASTSSILVRRGIPAVLAMQYEITDQAAIEFARSFYEALADGVPVDEGVSEARKAVSLSIPKTLEWVTPVLHLRAPDGVIFNFHRHSESALGSIRLISEPKSPPEDRPDRTIEFSIDEGDALTFEADIICLKHAQAFYGADEYAATKLIGAGIAESELRPAQGEYRLIATRGAIQPKRALFVGVPNLFHFGYAEIRSFAYRALCIVAQDAPSSEIMTMTIHGPGFGLDEVEAIRSQVAGLLDAIQEGRMPPQLKTLSIVDRNPTRVDRLRCALQDILDNSSQAVRVEGRWAYHLTVGKIGDPGSASAFGAELLEAGKNSEGRPIAFVSMPLSSKFDDIFFYGIQNAVHATNLLCERSSQLASEGEVFDRAMQQIEAAAVVIADISGANPIVYFEIGYALGRGRPIILIVDESEEPHFSAKGQRYLKYSAIRNLEELLKYELRAYLP
jgi:hypothetical protein